MGFSTALVGAGASEIAKYAIPADTDRKSARKMIFAICNTRQIDTVEI